VNGHNALAYMWINYHSKPKQILKILCWIKQIIKDQGFISRKQFIAISIKDGLNDQEFKHLWKHLKGIYGAGGYGLELIPMAGDFRYIPIGQNIKIGGQ